MQLRIVREFLKILEHNRIISIMSSQHFAWFSLVICTVYQHLLTIMRKFLWLLLTLKSWHNYYFWRSLYRDLMLQSCKCIMLSWCDSYRIMISIQKSSLTKFSLTAADDEKLTSDLLDRVLKKNILKNEYMSWDCLLELDIIWQS